MAAAVSGDQIAGVRGTSSPTSHLKTRLTGLVLSSAAAQTANYRLFTASGSFTVPAGVTRMIVEVRGAHVPELGGTGGGRGFAGAGGDGGAGASSGNGASGHGGLVLVTFLR